MGVTCLTTQEELHQMLHVRKSIRVADACGAETCWILENKLIHQPFTFGSCKLRDEAAKREGGRNKHKTPNHVKLQRMVVVKSLWKC